MPGHAGANRGVRVAHRAAIQVLKHDVQNMLVWHHLQKLQLVSDLGKGAIQEI